MNKKFYRALAVAMAALIIGCAGAGCAKNENKSGESSAASAESSDTSKESKAESKEESKAISKEESKTESSTESKQESKGESSEEKSEEESSEASKEESAESGAEESSEESSEESKEESTEESSEQVPVLTADDVLGSWEYNDGTNYMRMDVNSDGTVALSLVEGGEALNGTWQINDPTLVISVQGGASSYYLLEGKLVNTADAGEVLSRAGSNSGEQSAIIGFDPVGEWTYSGDGVSMGMAFYADGTAVIVYGSDQTVNGTWEFADSNSVNVSAAGGTANYVYEDGVLKDSEDPSQYFTKQ